MSQIVNQNYPNGLNPLGYMGVSAATPPQQTVQNTQAPTPTNSQNFTIGTQWVVTNSGSEQIWELVNLNGGVATWVQIYPAGGGGGGASSFPTDSGTANEVGGVLQIKGDGENISTEGSGNLVNVVLNDHITVQNITVESMDFGAVLSDGSGNLTSSAGTVGQVLTSSGASAAPVWKTLAGDGSVVGLEGDDDVVVSPNVDGIIFVTGNNGITTSGVANTMTVSLSVPVSIAHGGTNATTMATPDGVVYYDGTRLVTTASAGTVGEVLTSNGPGMAPTFQPGGGGGGGITTLTANTGGSATAASIKLQGNNVIATNVVSTSEVDFSLTNGTNGQVIIGGGANPTWASITAGTNITLTPGANSLTIASTGAAPAAGCAFLYYQPSIATGVTPVNTIYYLGQKVIMTSQYDNTGGAVTPGDGAGTAAKFTAPATGLYYLQFQATLGEVGATAFFPVATITITGNVSTQNSYVNWNTGSIPTSNYRVNIQMSGMFPMTIGDVAVFGVSRIPGGATGSSSDVWGTTPLGPTYPFLVSPSQVTYFSGFRVA
jgi:hypothetical protein